jgi:hypothetical protein
MKKIFIFLSFIIITFCLAKDNYSHMSNQELIAIIGYVNDKNKKEFFKELKQRVSTMNKKEKIAYEKNLKRLK